MLLVSVPENNDLILQWVYRLQRLMIFRIVIWVISDLTLTIIVFPKSSLKLFYQKYIKSANKSSIKIITPNIKKTPMLMSFYDVDPTFYLFLILSTIPTKYAGGMSINEIPKKIT